MWPNRKLLDLLSIEVPIIQAPMAGASGSAMAVATSEAGGLGSLPCAMLDAAKVRAELGVIRQRMTKPINVNFFCHTPAQPEPAPAEKPDLEPAGVTLPGLQRAREALSEGKVKNALENYASFLSQGEDVDALIQELESTEVEKPHQPQVNRLLGDAYVQKGDLKKALEVYQQALEML